MSIWQAHRWTFCALPLLIVSSCAGQRNCTPENLQRLDGLVDGHEIVAYVGKCHATVDDDVNVSFHDPEANLRSRTGDILHVYHAYNVKLERVAPDTVKVTYAASGDKIIFKSVSEAKGVTFVFENNWDAFE